MASSKSAAVGASGGGITGGGGAGSGGATAMLRKRRGDGPIRFRTHFRNVVYDVLKSRPGWVETDSVDEWDFMWNERDIAYETFDTTHLDAWQRINHFRNGREMCRKDLLAKNIKRHKRALEKEGKLEEAARFDFTPVTFILPGDYALFVEEFKKPAHAGALWIMKPIARSQGKGIFLFNKLTQIQQWKSEYRWKPEIAAVEAYVVQKYLAAPYLIGGKKFDLRIYALVTNYAPLTVWIYRSGFTRFSASRYSTDSSDIVNTYVHLTNVAVQKTSADYNPDFGGKWEIGRLKSFLACKHGADAANALFADVQGIMLRALFAVQRAIINDPHCFELYGYDILIDAELKPWLLEVNASPSMTASTRDDYDLKFKLLNDTLDIVDVEGRFTPVSGPGSAAAGGAGAGGAGGAGPGAAALPPMPPTMGGFDLVWRDGPIGIAASGAMPYNPTAAVVFGPPVPPSLAPYAAVTLGAAEPARSAPAAAAAGGAGDETPAAGASDDASSASAPLPLLSPKAGAAAAAVALAVPATAVSAPAAVPLYGGAGVHGHAMAAGEGGGGGILSMDGSGRPTTVHSSLMGAEFDRRVSVWPTPSPPPVAVGGAASAVAGGVVSSGAGPGAAPAGAPRAKAVGAAGSAAAPTAAAASGGSGTARAGSGSGGAAAAAAGTVSSSGAAAMPSAAAPSSSTAAAAAAAGPAAAARKPPAGSAVSLPTAAAGASSGAKLPLAASSGSTVVGGAAAVGGSKAPSTAASSGSGGGGRSGSQ